MLYKKPVLRSFADNLQKQWYVEYYCLDPESEKLVRKRVNIPKSYTLRQRYAKAETIIKELTTKLKSGWSPFDQDNPSKQTIINAIEVYMAQKEVYARYHTIRTLKNVNREFIAWLKITKRTTLEVSMFNKNMARQYADYLILKGGKAAVTYNKRIKFMKSLFNDFLDRGLTDLNPFNTMKPIKQPKPGIKAFTDEDRVKLFTYLQEHDQPMYMYCCFIFYLGARPTEIAQLKRSDVDLEHGTVTIRAEVAKNWQTQKIQVPKVFLQHLNSYVATIEPNHYIFSVRMQPGLKRVNAQRYSDRFRKYQLLLDIKNTPYHLKHTAIGLAFRSSGCSPKEVQLHFRHADLGTTMIYYNAYKSEETTRMALNFPDVMLN
jgi:integrase